MFNLKFYNRYCEGSIVKLYIATYILQKGREKKRERERGGFLSFVIFSNMKIVKLVLREM